uniref:Uncharacterized protein n=1 Tax=Marseillevirus sp. TaxID=2809551 RepID=A0AA96EPS5_9VIRU|nr:hypothetical protein MarQu_005 [Marseillevirus sp.]WNL50096.1 hypothetical protein MarDSR_057 [Marseillevirus sp.]
MSKYITKTRRQNYETIEECFKHNNTWWGKKKWIQGDEMQFIRCTQAIKDSEHLWKEVEKYQKTCCSEESHPDDIKYCKRLASILKKEAEIREWREGKRKLMWK